MAVWLFQGNPKHYTFDSYLRSHKQVTWHVNQTRYAPEMQPGDRVFIWRSDGGVPGSGGVVAMGVLTTRAGEVQDDGWGTWFDNKPGPAVPSVGVLLDDVRLTEQEGFLSKRALLGDPVLRNLGVIRMPRATNYRISKDEADRLSGLWQAFR